MDISTATLASTQIPYEKLLALLNASETMLEAVTHHDRQSVLDTVVELGHDLLEAESCSIFLVGQDAEYFRPNKLILVSHHDDLLNGPPANVEFPIRSIEGGGISAHVAEKETLLRLNYEDLKSNPYFTEGTVDYLPSGQCFSSIIVPLKDRKGVLLGILKVVNKKGVAGRSGPEIEFTEVDEAIIRILSDKVVVLLENLRVRKVIDRFMKDMQDARTRDSVPKLIIDWARDLLRANRSELALWNEGKKKLIFEAISGDDKARREWTGKPVPDEGFIMKVWQNDHKAWRIRDNVEEELNFYALDARTRSAIALRIEVEGTRIGILNVESFQPAWFDEYDRRTLELLAQHAALSLQLTRAERHFHDLSREVMENRAGSPEEILEKILWGIRESYGFDGGIFYLYQKDQKNLRCLASMGLEGVELNLEAFTLDFERPSLARHVFVERKPYYSEDPYNDPQIDLDVLRAFKGTGPLLGIPLVFRDEVKGVMVIWSDKNPPPSDENIGPLEPFARLAASKIALSQYEQDLADSEALYHSLVDDLPQRVYRKDMYSRFTSANASFCESLDRSLEEIKGTTDWDFYPEKLAREYTKDDKWVMRTKRLLDKEEKHQTLRMSEPIWIRMVKTPVLNSHGDVTGVQAIFWDITEERLLRKRYRSLVDQSPDSIILHHDGKITLANPAALELFGVTSQEELRERSILEFFHPDDRAQAKDRLEKLMRKEEVERMVEMRIQRDNGETVDVAIYARPSPGEKEAQLVIHDLTRIRGLLREMHHRVRKSLNQIVGFLTLQEIYTDSSPEVISVFRAIRNRVQASAIVHNILYRTGEESTVSMDTYLRELKEAVFEAYGIQDDRIQCTIHVKDIFLDERRATACGLIVNELLSNSITHAFGDNEDGEILVSLDTTPDSNFKLIVSDNGPGMRSEKESPRDSMGLRLVKRLVDSSLKGVLRLTNHKGLTFEITFPEKSKVRGM